MALPPSAGGRNGRKGSNTSLVMAAATWLFGYCCGALFPSPVPRLVSNGIYDRAIANLFQEATLATTRISTSTERPAEQAFAKLHLLITTFPGGFEQDFRPVFIRSLQFFWPREHIRLTVVLDDTVAKNDEERQQMIQKIKSFFDADLQNQIDVKFHPNTDPSIFGPGYDIQQNIGFWADNFTDAEYIGIVDDDTLFTRAIQPRDLFDEHGRPHTICKYVSGVKNPNDMKWKNGTQWALGWPGYLSAMNYFPVVLHRSYFPKVRNHILGEVHPEFSTFDMFFQKLWSRKKDGYSQFEIMFEYLWHYHRNEFNWHLEPEWVDDAFRNGVPLENASQYPCIQPGSPQDNNVTEDQLHPFPRIAVHGSWIPGGRMASRRKGKVVQLMKQGYCFSQPWDLIMNTTNSGTSVAADVVAMQRRCRAYKLDTDINIGGEWLFELTHKWPRFDPSRTAVAHVDRMKQNAPHNFSQEELRQIFQEYWKE